MSEASVTLAELIGANVVGELRDTATELADLHRRQVRVWARQSGQTLPEGFDRLNVLATNIGKVADGIEQAMRDAEAEAARSRRGLDARYILVTCRVPIIEDDAGVELFPAWEANVLVLREFVDQPWCWEWLVKQANKLLRQHPDPGLARRVGRWTATPQPIDWTSDR